MRGFITFVLFFIIFFTIPLAVFFYSVNSLLNPVYIKSRLSESNAYSVFAENVPQFIGIPEEKADEKTIPDEVKTEFTKFLKEEVTGEYLQNKIEPYIDDNFEWLRKEKSNVPELDFGDLSEKLDKLAMKHLLAEDLEQFLSTPLKYDPGDGTQIQKIYGLIQLAPLVLIIASLVILTLIILMAKGLKSKLRKFALALSLPSFFGLLITGTVFLLGSFIVGFVTADIDKFEFKNLGKTMNDLLIKIPLDLSVMMAVIFGALIFAAAVAFLASFFIKGGSSSSQNVASQVTPQALPK